MLHLIRNLPAGVRVLDLGAGAGSFPVERSDLIVIRVDLEVPHRRGAGWYASADAARLPFRDGVFDLIVSNHSLEHFPELETTVREMGRVLNANGALYIAVPDAGTLTDRIYRWLGRGGGHVNPFRSAVEVESLVSRLTNLPVRSTTALFSSFSFLNSYNFLSPPPRRIALFAYGNEKLLAVASRLLRGLDRRFGSRLAQYGWAFRFGNDRGAPLPEVWANVCVRCGSGHSTAYLQKQARMWKVAGLLPAYRCPACGGFNLLSPEFTPHAK